MSGELLKGKDMVIGYGSSAKPCALAGPLDLTLQGGGLVCLVGPNGCGKSTLLRTLAGLQKPLSGKVMLCAKEISLHSGRERARNLAVVFTGLPAMHGVRGFDLVALGRMPFSSWMDKLSAHDLERVRDAMEQTDCAHLAERDVDTLSDGERQRLAVARALAQEARVILLDEPTAYLDFAHRVDLHVRLRKLSRNRRLAILMSTHDLELALRFADTLVVMDGKGSLLSGAPEELAMQGVLNTVFANHGVHFDAVSGQFALDDTEGVPVWCGATGLEADWTRRALKRIGCRISATPDMAELHVILGDASLPGWIIRDSKGGEWLFPALQTMLAWLEVRLSK